LARQNLYFLLVEKCKKKKKEIYDRVPSHFPAKKTFITEFPFRKQFPPIRVTLCEKGRKRFKMEVSKI
jgi:hypothetical protein